jgi:hypothetical protein
MEGSKSGSIQIITDPDSGGPTNLRIWTWLSILNTAAIEQPKKGRKKKRRVFFLKVQKSEKIQQNEEKEWEKSRSDISVL